MAIKYGDIILVDGVVLFVDGDIATGDAKEQQIGAIVASMAGNFRHSPTMAANIITQIDGVIDGTAIASKVVKATGLDGWKISEMDIDEDDGQVQISIVEAEKITDDTDSLI